MMIYNVDVDVDDEKSNKNFVSLSIKLKGNPLK